MEARASDLGRHNQNNGNKHRAADLYGQLGIALAQLRHSQ